MLACPEQGCEEKFLENDEYVVHESYHTYHRKIKDSGRTELEKLERKFHVKISCPVIETVDDCYNFPQLPTRLICEWAGCSLEFLNVEAFYEHVADHAHKIVDRCYWNNCDKQMKNITPTLLRDHLRIHTFQKLYACPHCGHLFSTKIKFDDHFLRHAQLPSYVTNSFVEPESTESQKRSDMEIYVDTYSIGGESIKIYRCTLKSCDRAFLSSSLVCEHIRTHSNKNQCDQCPFIAKTLSRLQSHKLFRHENLRTYECSICSKSFKQRGDLRAHVKRHQIIHLKCDKCDFEANTEESYNAHSRLHDRNHEYLCHICSKVYTRGNNLSRHLINQHALSPPEGQSKFKYRLVNDGIYILENCEEPISVSDLVSEYYDIPSEAEFSSLEHNVDVI